MISRFIAGANVHANGIRQHYLRYGGAGRPLVLVPGITSPAITWGFVAEELARDFDVYVLDVRGRGLSEAGNHLDYGLDACAADIVAFVDALDLRGSLLLGHSMGARHAIRACRLAPGRFSRLALIDPPVSGPGRRPYPANLDWYVDSMALARRGAGIEALRRFTPSWTDEQIALRAEWLHTCDQAAILSSYAGFHDDDIHVDIPHLSLPTLLVAAGRGGVILDEDVEEIRALLPSIETCRVADAGHMIPWDDLPGFLAAVRPFLTA
ncbi:alpha/beta hydrolase [Sphingomonas oleivorans]|uniref:Alpha/beta hydrolase n=1 Tax=Sphingomonas oleivorans TaxID=1735121 RepID=A0A2T5FU08_9SPHN|nr:alpha/beta hydrolase [Sphingomonas oleivorans]PTQ07769.1 alpha/beta hydrolase [Sphingomonas oleivorans]